MIRPIVPAEPRAAAASPHRLGYAAPALPRRLPCQSRWGVAAAAMAGLTLAYSIVCTVGMFQAKGWDAMGWLIYGFIGNWTGAGVGLLLGTIGCAQRTRRRALAAHALWMNAAVVVLPPALIVVPQWLSR